MEIVNFVLLIRRRFRPANVNLYDEEVNKVSKPLIKMVSEWHLVFREKAIAQRKQ